MRGPATAITRSFEEGYSMKRFLWLACISCCCSLAVVACGDDDTGNNGDGGVDDGGASNPGSAGATSLSQVNKDLKTLKDDLKAGLDGVQGDIGDANASIDDLNDQAADLASRLDELEGVPNCSANQSCIPDGISISAMGLADIIETLCSLEINCCDADELNYKFGPGITTVKECTDTFTDLVNNGLSPSFLNQNGVLISRVISIAQAINSNDVQVEIDPKAVQACVDYLAKRECEKYVAPDEPEEVTHCEVVDYADTDDPCALSLLVKGLQKEGDVCGITGLNECAAGLVCRAVPSSVFSICASPSAVDDHCRSDADCDGTEQFCNLGTGKCQSRGDEGDDCEYVDPSFTYEGLNPGIVNGWENPQAVKVECKRGLICDPTTDKCVSNCSANTFCYSNVNCPDGLICNYGAIPGLRNSYNQGICTDPIATGEQCYCNLGTDPVGGKCIDNLTGLEQVNTQCESGRCVEGVSGLECADGLKAIGASCTLAVAGVGQADATCISKWCAGDGKCATQCTDNNLPTCPTGYYCNVAIPVIPYAGSPTSPNRFACEPKKANDGACHIQDITNGQFPEHFECTGGYCDASVSQCKPRLAATVACPATNSATACSNSFCKYIDSTPTYTCTAFIAAGGACNFSDARECGPGAYCGEAGTNANKCVAYAAAGAACDNANDVFCDTSGATSLSCALTSATAGVCAAFGMYPDGSNCSNGGNPYDPFCASHWCRGSDLTCQQPLAEGADCDIDDPEINHCAVGTFCDYDDLPTSDADYGKGTCVAQGTAGVACNPRFDGMDCLNNGCTLRNDQFVCESYSLPEETLFCDGE